MNTETKPTCLIYDLDGCVVDSSCRLLRHVDNSTKAAGDLESFYRGLYNWSQTTEGDVIIPEGVGLVQHLIAAAKPDRLIALTARGSEGRAATLPWMQANLPWEVRDEDLIMGAGRFPNAEGMVYDHSAPNLRSVDHKREKALEIMKSYRILYALDDHPEICEMYQQLGIPTLRTLWPGIDCLTPAGDRVK